MLMNWLVFESFDVVQSGTCQMIDHLIGLENHGYLLSGIPFGFNQQEMAAWFYHGDGMIFE